ncbi:hypothetical protein EKI60_04985 [Candidatus Saccharibacteria bacterium]|nr:MAG: hypothetical protein EKI60_04985 [Candidatus Saccharibacteria bacterium]
MKIAIITCHNQPDYIRAVTLRKAVSQLPDHVAVIIKNKHTGVLRYPEMIARLATLRIRHNPDTYLLTFRGYELLPFACLLTWPKTLIYDEFINPIEWLQEPRSEKWAKLIPIALLKPFYKVLLKRCKYILVDTQAHAQYSAQIMNMSSKKFTALPVSTNEEMFKPSKQRTTKTFKVFYYGNMLALHGLEVVLDAALQLKSYPIEFRLIGGKKAMADKVREAQANGANISYEPWTAFDTFPSEISSASLCLGGPFGTTPQSQRVITGKTYQFLASAAPTVVGENLASSDFKDKENCLKIQLGNSEALAEAIVWALEHPKQLATIAANGRKLYDKKYSIEKLSDQLSRILAA